MIELLVWLIIAIVLMYVAYLLTSRFVPDGTLKTVILLILFLIFLLIILSHFGMIAGVGI